MVHRSLTVQGPFATPIACVALLLGLCAGLEGCSSEHDSSDATGSGGSALEATGGTSAVSDASGGSGTGGADLPITVSPAAPYAGDVTLRDATVDFVHQEIETASSGSLVDHGNREIVTTTFPVKIIENDLVRVTVLPEYGGRLLSIIYKPTNHELLYQNTVGTPFGDGAGNFYYDWLMVYGGIFATFPEPEHGKTWFLPWEYAEISASPDEVIISMSFTDDIDPVEGVPPKWPESDFNKGRTDLRVTATVSVARGSAGVGFDVAVENTRDSPVDYEYWTCTTLTPGSTPGDTFSPRNSEIIAPLDRVYTPYYRNWMNEVQGPLVDTPRGGGSAIYAWDQLAHFSEWRASGILYAEPRMDEDYWGVINHDNQVGVFRVADADATPGLKIWTWGAASVDEDPLQPNSSRPYIELWAGHSSEFFRSVTMAPREVKAWAETYLPTIGLSEITHVNEHAAAHLKVEGGQFTAEIFSAHPSLETEVTLFALGGGETVLSQELWLSDPTTTSNFSAAIPAEATELGVRLSAAGKELFAHTVPAAP